MLKVPENLTRADVAFGNIQHMPKFDALPKEYQERWHDHSHPYCGAVSKWFYSGAKGHPNGIEIGGVKFTAKPGVDPAQALAAVKSVLGSFEPKHEHKIAACGYMLSEWFDREEAKAA